VSNNVGFFGNNIQKINKKLQKVCVE